MSVSRKSKLLSGAAVVAALCASAAASGQDDGDRTEVITVTGSRIVQTGMQTPVPVTAVGAAELEQFNQGNMVEGLTELPQFYGGTTPTNQGNFFIRGGVGNLDLRGLGINRTLTLLNGRRMISQTAFGGVDVNLFPEAMISRVETVTGGASAAYGTDAVAGVVNFILDTEFTGIAAHGQAGISDRGDHQSYEASLSYGADLGDRAHVLLSGEYYQHDGVFTYEDRDWYQSWGTIPGGPGGTLQARPNVVSANASFNGLIFAPGSALHQTEFLPDGSGVTPFVLGEGNGFGNPGARHSIANGGSGDDLGGDTPTLAPDFERESIFAYLDYDVTDDLTVYGQFMHGRNYTWSSTQPKGSLQGTPTAATIFVDNAFLPESVRQIMIDEGLESFTFKRHGSSDDLGLGGFGFGDESVLRSFTGGFTMDINSAGSLFDGWTVDGYYQYGVNERTWTQVGLRVDRIHAALDAVVDPETNEIVCRTTLFNDHFEGCQPLNLFGRGNASAAAVDWVVGNEPGENIETLLFFADTGFRLNEKDNYVSQEAKVNLTDLEQHLFDISGSGEIYEGWGAGPITMAIGASYRKENIRQIVRDSTNRSSDHENGHPVLCNTDPEAIAAGLRGVSQPDCTNTVGIQFSKVSNIQGQIQVSEAFTETLVPLIADQPFMEQLTLHLAARWADYSGSGTIWAYKGGIDAQITDDFRLRGTYSRDVRAANLSERFDKTGGIAVGVQDPRYNETYDVTRFSGGNPNVAPEQADTVTIGGVFQPSFIPGLSISADWYEIEITDAIAQLGIQNVVNQCEAGAQDLCALITRDAITDRMILIGDVFVNVAQAKVSGVDLEAAYRRDISLFGGAESIGARVFASWLEENSQIPANGVYVDRAGQTGFEQDTGIAYQLPDFKLTGMASYDRGGLSTYLTARYIGEGVSDNAPPNPANTLEDNTVDSVLYFDAGASYGFGLSNGAEVELFGSVINLTDEDPPLTPYWGAFGGSSIQTNSGLFDVLGRRYVAGVRLRF